MVEAVNDTPKLAHFCDFCGKHQDFVKYLIAGNKVDICDECIDICKGVIEEKRKMASEGDKDD